MFLVGMAWISWLGKGKSKHLYCPYCSTKNDVFVPRPEFTCDMCGRVTKLTRRGEVDFDEEQHISVKQY